VAKHLAPHVERYHLLDVSAQMLRKAKEHLGDLIVDGHKGKVELHKGDGYNLLPHRGGPLEAATIDFAFCDLVLQHIDQEVALWYLMQLRVILADRAWLWLQVPAMRYPERFDEAKRGDWPANLHRWRPGDLLEAAVRLGWRVIAADLDSIQLVLENGVRPWEGPPWLGDRSD
jgi:hypothetical protein